MAKTSSTTKTEHGTPHIAGALSSVLGTNDADTYYKTTITDGDRTVTGTGRTSEEAESNASKKW